MSLRLENRPIKIKHNIEHTFIPNQTQLKIKRKTRLFPLFDVNNDIQIGFFFNGKVEILSDLLIHSNMGVVGKAIENVYSKGLILPAQLPFFTERNTKKISESNEENFQIVLLWLQRLLESDMRIFLQKINGDFKIMILTNNPFKFWSIQNETVIHLNQREIMMRNADKYFTWASSSYGLYRVNEQGQLSYTSLEEHLNPKEPLSTSGDFKCNKIYSKILNRLT